MPYADPEQQARYQREWIAKRRADWFAGRACIDCGATSDLVVDHRDPKEKVDHKVWSWREDRREAELAKCDVRCDSCHRKRHADETRRHGIEEWRRGCKCEVCRNAKVRIMERERAKR